MIQTTENFEIAVSKSSRTFVARLLYNEEELECGIRTLKIYKGGCGGNSFAPGSVYSSYIDATIDIRDYPLENKELKVQIGLVLEDGSIEYVDMGYYTVTSPKSTAYQTSFTAVGRISAKLDNIFEPPKVCSIENIADSISLTTGIPIVFNEVGTAGVISKSMKGLTCKEALEVITNVLGGFATEDSEGNIVICKFNQSETFKVDGDRMTALPEFNDYDYELYGIKVIVSNSGEDEDGDTIEEVSYINGDPKLILSNPYMTENLFGDFCKNIVGYKFRPGKVSLALGDPRIEPWDSVSVEDVRGNTYFIPCLNIVHTFDGGLVTEMSAPGESESESASTSKGPIVQQLERINATLLTVNSAILNRLKATEAELLYAKITDLDATNANIEKLKANSVTAEYLEANYATIKALNAASATIESLKTNIADVEKLMADKATIKSLDALEAKVEKLETTFITAEAADLKYATIETLNAINATVKDLSADKVDINMANIDEAWITNLLVKGKFLAADVNSAVGSFSKYLTGVNIIGDNITAGTIKTDRLIIRDAGSDTGILYALNNGIVEQTDLSSEELKRLALDGAIIVAESITADKINVTDLFAQDITSTGSFNMGGNGALYYDSEKDELSIKAKNISIGGSSAITDKKVEEKLENIKPYLYIRYSPVANPTAEQMTAKPQENSVYMGLCHSSSEVAPEKPSYYTWQKTKGDKGATGATGATGAKGDKGDTGATGKDAAIQSTTAPSDTSYMWLDISTESPVLKRYNPTTQVWEIINDTTSINEAIVVLKEHTDAELVKTEESILSTVKAEYYSQTDAEELATNMSTQIKQTASDLTIKFEQFNADLEALSNGTDAEFEQIRKYIRFVDGKILLGEVGNELELSIANNRISFMQSGAEVAYFSNNKLYVVDGEFTNSLKLGDFSFVPRSNGNLSLKKV